MTTRNKILLAILALFIVAQFIRPAKNTSGDETMSISKGYPVPEELNKIFVSACNDCHSNKTNYPWYSNIQPLGWWLANHVNDGKRHFNLSTFTSLPIAVQNHKLEETIEEIKEKGMPLPSYTWLGLHDGADITDEQRNIIMTWAQQQMDSLKSHYPPDSLVMKRRNPVKQ